MVFFFPIKCISNNKPYMLHFCLPPFYLSHTTPTCSKNALQVVSTLLFYGQLLWCTAAESWLQRLLSFTGAEQQAK